MIVFPNCKINLGLNIIRKREDGFHDLETVFFPLPLHDALEIVPAGNNAAADCSFSSSGLPIEGEATNNLCVKAYRLLKADFPDLPAINMHLYKHIPMGAGLGGGSSNGAFTLSLLNQLFNLALSQQQLVEYASQLGSDCAFFIVNQPCFATGRGELMQPVSLFLKGYQILLVHPDIHISTKEAFAGISPKAPANSAVDIMAEPVENWKGKLINDFETSIFPLYPQLAVIKQHLYNSGAIYASLTGTGSTVYGIFKASDNIAGIFDQQLIINTVIL